MEAQFGGTVGVGGTAPLPFRKSEWLSCGRCRHLPCSERSRLCGMSRDTGGGGWRVGLRAALPPGSQGGMRPRGETALRLLSRVP